MLRTLVDSAKSLTSARYGNMEEISETELEDLQKMMDTFRPTAEQLLPADKVNSLMAYMAEVIHSEFYAVEVKLPWPDNFPEDGREDIRDCVRKMLNGLISRRFISELKRATGLQ